MYHSLEMFPGLSVTDLSVIGDEWTDVVQLPTLGRSCATGSIGNDELWLSAACFP